MGKASDGSIGSSVGGCIDAKSQSRLLAGIIRTVYDLNMHGIDALPMTPLLQQQLNRSDAVICFGNHDSVIAIGASPVERVHHRPNSASGSQEVYYCCSRVVILPVSVRLAMPPNGEKQTLGRSSDL